MTDGEWEELGTAFGQLERLAGDQIPRTKAWSQLQRHLAWRQGVDLHDIAESDWPAVRSEIQQNLYSELEPVPVAVEDLGSLAESKPRGTVTTALRWSNLSAEEFERLIFNLISDADGYANPQWLMQTAAADRGRDLSVERVVTDALSGTIRERVITQAKHWLTRSVSVDDLAGLAAQMELWGHPSVDVLIIATSGRFTADAVDWVETHDAGGTRPRSRCGRRAILSCCSQDDRTLPLPSSCAKPQASRLPSRRLSRNLGRVQGSAQRSPPA